MANVTSAGTLVAAALQTAGLVTQERILYDFEPFFTSGGALLYVFAGIGAVFSVTLFGNFRMARYILIGPALFWFLVGTYTYRGGVVWQLGGGEPRTVQGQADAEASAEQTAQVVDHSGAGANADGNADGERLYRVSFAFNWFTSLIDNFTNELVDVILYYENDEDLMFISRTKAFEALVNSKIDDTGVLEMFQGTFNMKCGEMMSAAWALSSPHLDLNSLRAFQAEAGLGENTTLEAQAAEVTELIQRERDRYQGIYNRTRMCVSINPGPAMFDYMRRRTATPGAVQDMLNGRAVEPETDSSGASDECREAYNNRIPGPGGARTISSGMSIRCGDAYNILTQAIMENAQKIYEQILEKTIPPESDEARRSFNEQLLCQEVANKIGVETNSAVSNSCDLVQVTAMFLIRNTLTSSNAQSSYIQRHKNQMQFLGSTKPDDQIVAIAPNRDDLELVGGYKHYEVRADPSGQQITAKFKNKKNGQEEWYPIGRLGVADGHMGLAFDKHQSYQSREIRQKIFSWSMQLPYYQGTLLYLISIAYPFVALIVIMPGQAQAFLHIPLAWLWVKSWDVGFALVMVFEEVLWNILPQSDVDIMVMPDGVEAPPLPDLLRTSMEIDPTFHVHGYYYFVSLALFAVPQITGYATLKAKKSILASFTEGPKRLANASGERAASHYGITKMSGMQQAMVAGQSAALMSQSPIQTGGTAKKNAAEMSAGKWALGAMAVRKTGDVAKGLMGGSPGSVLKNLGTSDMTQMASTFSTLRSAEVKRAAHQQTTYSSLGAYSARNKMLSAGVAAMEGQTFGFDRSDAFNFGHQATNALMSLYGARFGAYADAVTSAADGVAQGGAALRQKVGGRVMTKLLGSQGTAREPDKFSRHCWWITFGLRNGAKRLDCREGLDSDSAAVQKQLAGMDEELREIFNDDTPGSLQKPPRELD